jgi:holo-[acyl-carrier protein] synthase
LRRRRRSGGQRTGKTKDKEQIPAMIVGVGSDLAEVERIKNSVERFGDRFLKRIYTAHERSYAMQKANWAERLAARFAAKEAGMKAIGTGLSRGVSWQHLEVANEPSGRPTLRLYGAALAIATDMGVKRISISLTHTKDMAFAIVILEN